MLGIDVSKETLACTLLDPSTRQVVWQAQFPNSEAGVRRLLERAPAAAPWVMEPTGRYSLRVAKPAARAGRDVLLAPNRRARDFLRSVQSRAKTDPLDSRGLALFALSQPLPAYPIKSDAVEELDQLLTARRGITAAITRLEQQRSELSFASEPLAGAVSDLKARLKALDGRIGGLTADKAAYPHVHTLRGVPGIGPVTAAAVASCLQSRTFTHPDQFVAYIGLDVGVVQSGKKKGDRGLTRQGHAELRRLLFLCARAACNAKDAPFRAQYEREVAKGLTPTAAHCALARKLARLCWSLVRHNTAYDSQRVYKQFKADTGKTNNVGKKEENPPHA